MFKLVLLTTLTGLVSSLFDEKLDKMYKTLPRAEFIEYFNKQNYSWMIAPKPRNIKFFVCAHRNSSSVLPIRRNSLDVIKMAPDSFDSRKQWPQCASINQILDQGYCGSCWAFGTAMTASDRTCIHKNIQVNLSEQDFECFKTKVCDGGNPDEAFQFWRDTGLVTQQCKPYNVILLVQNTCTQKCVDGVTDYNGDKHFASKVYAVSSDADNIKAEISQNGPIEATMNVYDDFNDYNSGIYEHTYGELVGPHSVRLIGYGVENGVAYWLGASSWGEGWGDGGFFKIKQFQPDIGIEKDLYTGMPK